MKEANEVNFSAVDEMSTPDLAVQEMDAVRSLAGIRALKQQAMKFFAPQVGERLLDVGCGSGEDVRELAVAVGPDGEVSGIDLSERMIDEAKRRTPSELSQVRYSTADVHHLPFLDGSLDGCWCERALQHVQNPPQVISEMYRVLSPGGRIILLDTDWETFVVASEKVELTRRILNAFGACIQNPWIGRELTGLSTSGGFFIEEVFTETIHSTSGDLLFDGLDFENFLRYAESMKTISAAEYREWREELEQRMQSGRFFFSVTLFGVLACKS